MEDKKHSFMDQLNLFFIGAVIGVYEKFDFCMELPIGLSIKPIKKHKG